MVDLEERGPFDAVVHLAGAGIGDKRWTPARKAEILGSRVDGTSLLAARCAALSVQPSVFVSGSAIGFYGSHDDVILSESSPVGDGFLADVCLHWENAASPIQEAGVRTVFARTGVVLDPSGGALAKQLPLFRWGLGGKLGAGTQWFSWITLQDEVAALLALIDDDRYAGPVNLTGPNPVTNEAFTKSLSGAVHRPALFRVPGFALSAALGAELADQAILASSRVIPGVLNDFGFQFEHPEIDEALVAILGLAS
jgi:uncharacterized protein (TIGR01777 family)